MTDTELPREASCAGRLEKGWWNDRELLWSEYVAHGSLAAVARAHPGSPVTLGNAWALHGLPKLGKGPKTPERDPAQQSDHEIVETQVLAGLKKLGDRCSIIDLANEVDMSPAKVEEVLGRLDTKGYRVESADLVVSMERHAMPSNEEHRVLFDGEVYRFGIASDVHLNSKHCRLEELHIAYDRFLEEGIDTVYNPGDITAGRGIYKGQDHEILHHTYADQVDFVEENYPSRKGITTKIISGNHDCEGDFGKAGADACLAVCNRREDIEWCGRYAADFVLPNGTVMTMRHPMGGSSYAKSYKPQKFAESFEGGSKPGVVLFGHWHNMEWGIHRNIHMINCGTFEGFGGSLGLRVPLGEPAVGFFIVEMTLAEDASIVRFKPEWFSFFQGRRSSG